MVAYPVLPVIGELAAVDSLSAVAMQLLIQFKRYMGLNPATATDDKCTGGKRVLERAF